jgi:threonine dehydratase
MTASARPQPRQVAAPDADDLRSALAAVRAELAPTPLVDSSSAGALLKLESAQPTGAFKVRGALAALTAIPRGTPIVTASTGNHALAVAWAAERLDRRATVVVPETASDAKLAGLRRFEAEIVRHGSNYDDAEANARERADADGAEYLSP